MMHLMYTLLNGVMCGLVSMTVVWLIGGVNIVVLVGCRVPSLGVGVVVVMIIGVISTRNG